MNLGLKCRPDSKVSAVSVRTTRSARYKGGHCPSLPFHLNPYSSDMNLRKLLTALSHNASRKRFLESDEVEMAPMSKNEWMDGEFHMEVADETMGRVHKSADVSWFLVTDTHFPHSQTVCFGFSELQWKPNCLPLNQ